MTRFSSTQKAASSIAASQFGVAFSFNCIMAFMPFYILRISPLGERETMIWTGMIMGASNVTASLTASFWGSLTSRFRPKFLYERGILLSAILVLLMGFIQNLHALLLIRIAQGVLGGISTIGLVLISSVSSGERLHRDFSLFQNAITTGQLIGPPLGALVATRFGYRAPFVFAFLIFLVSLIFCHLYVSDIPPEKKKPVPKEERTRGVVWAWSLSFTATLHIAFLPSILPSILNTFQLTGTAALHAAGLMIMAYTVTAILGTFALSRLASKIGLKRVIALSGSAAAIFVFLLIASRGVIGFSAIRMVETGFIASVFPLTVSLYAPNVGGGMIGFLNSARFLGMALGPILATSVLAYSNLLTLCVLIAGLTLASLWGFFVSTRARSEPRSSDVLSV